MTVSISWHFYYVLVNLGQSKNEGKNTVKDKYDGETMKISLKRTQLKIGLKKDECRREIKIF